MRTVLITGANRGIGFEFAKQYTIQGWNVLACCREPSQAKELKLLTTQLSNIQVLKLDVAAKNDLQKLVCTLQDKTIDLLINNAGVFGPQGMEFSCVEDRAWIDVFQVNTIAPLNLVNALISQIANSELKTVVAISSDMGSIGANNKGGDYLYRASKAALNCVIKNLSIDLKPQNITVLSLHPGWVKTDMGGMAAPLMPEESVTKMRNLLNSVTILNTGQFLNYNGEVLPW